VARRIKKRGKPRNPTVTSLTRKTRVAGAALSKSPLKRRRRNVISNVRLERALRVFSRTKDLAAAARSIRVSKEKLKRAAIRRLTRRRRRGGLRLIRRLPRKMPIFSGGRQLAITVNSRAASLIGRYMAAVGKFLKTNDPKSLAEFTGRSVKDVSGKIHQFETDPNTLYRLSSAGGEPFEEMYRIVI
jgi:hypothetical protein